MEDLQISFTEQELNTLGAKLVKAEILGNTELAGRLKAQLEEARAARYEDFLFILQFLNQILT